MRRRRPRGVAPPTANGHPASMWILALTIGHAAPCEGFRGPVAPSEWVAQGIQGGAARVDLAASNEDQLVFRYAVDLGNPGTGIPYRETGFAALLPKGLPISFDYTYSYFHAFFDVQATLAVRGAVTVSLVDEATGGNVTVAGSVAGVVTSPGGQLAVVVGGGNFDTNSKMEGSVTLENLRFDHASCDCAGELDGAATVDACGVCDDDLGNDCVLDCFGEAGGSAFLDDCGECVGGGSGREPCMLGGETADTGEDIGAGVALEGCQCRQGTPDLSVFAALRRRRASVSARAPTPGRIPPSY
jgi:hypothetical protein